MVIWSFGKIAAAVVVVVVVAGIITTKALRDQLNIVHTPENVSGIGLTK